jgi:hypothetical protein
MDRFALEAPGCVLLYVGSVYMHDSTGKQSPDDHDWKTIISLIQYIQVYTMPVWYILVYTSTSQYENPHTSIYRDIPWCTKSSGLVQVVGIPDAISVLISGPISGCPISGSTTTDIGVNIGYNIGWYPILVSIFRRYSDIGSWVARYRCQCLRPDGHRSGVDSPGLHQSHDEMFLTVTVGFSMRRSTDPMPSRMLEPLHELEPWRACPTESTSRPFRTVRTRYTRACQRFESVFRRVSPAAVCTRLDHGLRAGWAHVMPVWREGYCFGKTRKSLFSSLHYTWGCKAY